MAFRTRYDQEEPPSLAVVRAIAAIEGTDAMELDVPLYGAVDPDALDRLLGDPDRNGHGLLVAFALEGYRISVHGDGIITIRDGEPASEE